MESVWALPATWQCRNVRKVQVWGVCVLLCQYLPVKEATGMKQGWQHKQLLPAEFASLKHHYTLHRMLGYQDYTKDGFS